MWSSISEFFAPLPSDEHAREALKKKSEEVNVKRRQLTEGVGHRTLARRALGFDRETPQAFSIHEERGGLRNLTINPDSPTVHGGNRSSMSPFSKQASPSVSSPGQSTPVGPTRPSSSGMYSPQTPLSPYINATEVPESIILQAGEAGYATALYPEEVNKLHSHHLSFFKHCGASKKKRDEFLEMLKNELDIDPGLIHSRSSKDSTYSWTGLHIAAKENNVAMCKLLLSRDADAWSVDIKGRTPLHLAAKELHSEVCTVLYKQMESMDGKPPKGPHAPVDLKGWTPAMYCQHSKANTEAQAKAKEYIRNMLYEHGDPHISPRNKSGGSTLRFGTNSPLVESTRKTFTFGHQWMKGWRPSFEDTYVAEPSLPDVKSIAVFGIFDGHGGVYTSRFVADNIVKDFNAEFLLEKHASSRTEEDLCEDPKLLCKLLERVFFGLEAKLRKNPMLSGECKGIVEVKKKQIEDGKKSNVEVGQNNEKFDSSMSKYSAGKAPDTSGTTAVFVVITPTYIITANVGDSRAVIFTSSDVASSTAGLTNDHTPRIPSESERVQKAGGFVWRDRVYAKKKDMERDMENDGTGNASIAMTRSLGDFSFKNRRDPVTGALLPPMRQPLLCLPEIMIRKRRTDDKFLLLACDGIWDVMDDPTGKSPNHGRERACNLLNDSISTHGFDGIDDCIYDLLIKCMDEGTTDNLSAVAVLFDKETQKHLEFHPFQGGEFIQTYKSEYLAEDGITILTPAPTVAGGVSAELQSRLDSRPNYEEGISILKDASEAGRTKNVSESSGANRELADVLQRRRDSMGQTEKPGKNTTVPAPTAEMATTEPSLPESTDPGDVSLESINLNEE